MIECVIVYCKVYDVFFEVVFFYVKIVKFGDLFDLVINFGLFNNVGVVDKMDWYLDEVCVFGFDVLLGGGCVFGFVIDLYYDFMIVDGVIE